MYSAPLRTSLVLTIDELALPSVNEGRGKNSVDGVTEHPSAGSWASVFPLGREHAKQKKGLSPDA